MLNEAMGIRPQPCSFVLQFEGFRVGGRAAITRRENPKVNCTDVHGPTVASFDTVYVNPMLIDATYGRIVGIQGQTDIMKRRSVLRR